MDGVPVLAVFSPFLAPIQKSLQICTVIQGLYKTRGLANTRIEVADALRGMAVGGIILYHSVEHFDIFTKEPLRRKHSLKYML